MMLQRRQHCSCTLVKLSVRHGHGSADIDQLATLQVRAISNSFAEADGAPLTWRTDQRYSGLNIGVLGIFYEPLQRCAQAQSCASC